MSVAVIRLMAVSRRRMIVTTIAAVYLAGAAALTGLVAERVRLDHERMSLVRAQERRAREARARAIRIELQHESGRGVRAP